MNIKHFNLFNQTELFKYVDKDNSSLKIVNYNNIDVSAAIDNNFNSMDSEGNPHYIIILIINVFYI